MKFLSNCFHPDFLYPLPLFKLFLLLFSRYQNIIIVIALLWGIPMKSFKRNGHRLFLSLLLSVLLLLQACSSGQTPANNIASQTPESKQFTELTDTIFKENVSSDALSLNYTLSDPEKYGINPAVGGFEPISYEKMANAAPENENLLNSLENINKSSLSIPQQILYDNLTYTLQMNLKEQEFILFSRAISPVTGLQAQLPVLLAEYDFNSVHDVENYFSLLSSIPGYFDSILTFCGVQAEHNMLPCRDTLEHIASQCSSFIENKGAKILKTSFSTRIKSCSFLDQNARRTYRKKNKELVKSCILPAYRKLTDGLNHYCQIAGTDGSLSSYNNGKKYYEYLFASESGTSTNVEDYFKYLEERLRTSKETLLSYAKKDPALFSGLSMNTANKQNGKSLSPEEQLTRLSSAIEKDFPKASDVNFTVCYVDKSLEDYLSPAFYLTPPLDSFTENAIYINNSRRYAGSDLSTTLAHEGYPGHLYQNVYYRQKDRPLLSYILNFSGYTEGWATYAELYSYKYLGYSKDEVGILRNNMIISLCIYGICDIGIHYYGWKEENVLAFLNEHGSYDTETAHSLYSNIIDEPGSYLKYTIGYMEFMKLKDAVKAYMGDRFTEMAFHEFVLSAGPAPFDTLKNYIKNMDTDLLH